MSNVETPGPLDAPYHGHTISKLAAERAAAREARIKASQGPNAIVVGICALVKRLLGKSS